VNVTPKLYGVTAHRLEAACGLTLEGGYPTRYCKMWGAHTREIVGKSYEQ
jgi:hypothetical protein